MKVDGDIKALITASVERRRRLIDAGTTNAYRLVNGAADGMTGLVIERLGPVLIVQFHEGRLNISPESVRPSVERLIERFDLHAAYAKFFVRDRSRLTPEQAAAHTSAAPWLGRPVEKSITITEFGTKFIIRPYDGFSYGLFLEHRENRRRMGELAKNLRVLNLFCYTCGFSTTAALGGAGAVTSVDLSKRYLDWGRENLKLNGIDASRHLFFVSDSFEFYRRAERQDRKYDLVILDPPTFSRQRRPARAFVLEKQIGPLLKGAIELLDAGGHLFFATNNRAMNQGRIEREIHRVVGSRKARIVDRPGLPIDFAGDADYSHSVVAKLD